MIATRRFRCQTTPVLPLLLSLVFGISGYKVPAATVEPLAQGFRVSIPDENGVKMVAFNVNRNRNFTGFEPGEFSAQVRESQDGRWQYDFVKAALRAYDTLSVWTNVQHGSAIYRGQGQPLQVCELSGNYLPEGCKGHSEEITEKTQTFSHTRSTPTPSNCKEISETVTSPAQLSPPCKGQLLFEETFDELNETLWQHEVRFPIDTKDAEFVLYDGRARVRDGHLIIEPKLWASYRPDLDITHAQLDLSERCTGTHDRRKQCLLTTGGPVIMPPVVAPRLSTKDTFQFKYGHIEIRAKMPKGDWIVPLLLLEPYMEAYGQTGYESGQLRVAMIRANEQLRLPQGKLLDGRTLLAGPVLSTEASQREDFMVQLRRSEHFGSEFHLYGLEWSSIGFRFTIDGKDYGELLNHYADSELNTSWRRGGPMAPFDRMFYITLGLSVGGFGDFVDRLRTASYEKPWFNKHPQAKLHFWQSQNDWLPSWKQPSLMVDYVRVYAV